MKKMKWIGKLAGIVAAGALISFTMSGLLGCNQTLDDEDERSTTGGSTPGASSGGSSGTGSGGTATTTQTNVSGTYTAAAGKSTWTGAGSFDMTAFDTSNGVAISYYIENTTTDQTCVFQADGNIQICAGYVWLPDDLGGGFFEGDNTITANTWEKAKGTHYETVVFNKNGSVDWYLDGELTFNWTGKSTQVNNLFKALKAGVVNILPQTNSTTDVTVSKISYSSALNATQAKALYDANKTSTGSGDSGEGTGGSGTSGESGESTGGQGTSGESGSGEGTGGESGESGTPNKTQSSVSGTYTAAAGKSTWVGAGTFDMTSFDTTNGVALSFYIENTTTDQTCVFQADGNIQICAGYVWLPDTLGGAFFEGDNTITANTWAKAVGTHYETVVFNTDGSVDWYLDGELTYNWTGKSTQVASLLTALKAGAVSILPQTNSTTDVTVSKISYSSALTADEVKALYDANKTSSEDSGESENGGESGENTGDSGESGTTSKTQTGVSGTYTAAAGKSTWVGAGTFDMTSFDTTNGVALSFYIENTTTDQTCVFQADGNIQICAGYIWLPDTLGGAFFEGDNTITANTWANAVGTHYETVVFNTDGSVDWYLDGELTYNWTGKSTQVTSLLTALKAAAVSILPQTNSTTDVSVSKISYSSALTAEEVKALYAAN